MSNTSLSTQKEDESEALEVREDPDSSSLVIRLSGTWLSCRVILTCVLLRDPAHGGKLLVCIERKNLSVSKHTQYKRIDVAILVEEGVVCAKFTVIDGD